MDAQTNIPGNLSGQASPVFGMQETDLLALFVSDQDMEKVIKMLIGAACEGNVNAAKLLFERKYGKAPARVERKTDTVIRVEYA